MNTLAQQLQPGGVARRAADHLDGHPERADELGEALGAGTDASAGVARPRLGTRPTSATSANGTGSAAASSRLSPGEDVFRSA